MKRNGGENRRPTILGNRGEKRTQVIEFSPAYVSLGVLLDFNRLRIERKLGITRIHLFQGAQDDLGQGDVARPLVVRGDNIPWRPFARAIVNGIFVGLLIIAPACALLEIVGNKLPPFVGTIEPRLQSSLLFVFRNVKHELHDRCAVFR